jgi:hypothetical protein
MHLIFKLKVYFYLALNVLEKFRHKQHTILHILGNTMVFYEKHTILQKLDNPLFPSF